MKAAVLTLLVLWGLSQITHQTERQLTKFEARVTAVHDGDTFIVETDSQKWVCRLENVDAPELAQPFGVASRDSVRALLLGRTVRVKLIEPDIYRRWRVLVWVRQVRPDELSGTQQVHWERVDSLLVEQGWAWHYMPYSRDRVCAGAMVRAQAERLGLWQAKLPGSQLPMAPWLYRKQRHIGL